MLKDTIKDKDKLSIMDSFLDLMESRMKSDQKDMPRFVGTLNKQWGLNGYKIAEIGHPVFEFGGRYIIHIETLDGLRSLEIPFLKDTLKPAIDFFTFH